MGDQELWSVEKAYSYKGCRSVQQSHRQFRPRNLLSIHEWSREEERHICESEALEKSREHSWTDFFEPPMVND